MTAPAGGLVWAAVVLLAGCASGGDDSMVFSIHQSLATSGGPVAMAEIVPGDWDRMCVFTTNATSAQVDSGSSSTVSDPDRVPPVDYSLLAFMEGDAAARTTRYPVDRGEFAAPGPEPWYCLPRDAAVFEMRSPIDGSIPWIGPVRPQ